MSDTAAIVVTSGVFGAWHIRPTLQALRANGWPATAAGPWRAPVPTVAATAAGGALLSWLRARSGRLAAPVLLHAAVNSGGLIAAHVVVALAKEGDPWNPDGLRPIPPSRGLGPASRGTTPLEPPDG